MIDTVLQLLAILRIIGQKNISLKLLKFSSKCINMTKKIKLLKEFTYYSLIKEAIYATPSMLVTSNDIFKYFVSKYPDLFRLSNSMTWKGNVRQVLSRNPEFIKVRKKNYSNLHFWTHKPIEVLIEEEKRLADCLLDSDEAQKGKTRIERIYDFYSTVGENRYSLTANNRKKDIENFENIKKNNFIVREYFDEENANNYMNQPKKDCMFKGYHCMENATNYPDKKEKTPLLQDYPCIETNYPEQTEKTPLLQEYPCIETNSPEQTKKDKLLKGYSCTENASNYLDQTKKDLPFKGYSCTENATNHPEQTKKFLNNHFEKDVDKIIKEIIDKSHRKHNENINDDYFERLDKNDYNNLLSDEYFSNICPRNEECKNYNDNEQNVVNTVVKFLDNFSTDMPKYNTKYDQEKDKNLFKFDNFSDSSNHETF